MAFLPKKRPEDPTSLTGLQGAVNRLFSDFFGRMDTPSLGSLEFLPAVDVVETPAAIQVKAELPGIDPKNLDISVSGDLLTIRGEKKGEKEEKGKNYHRIERSYGSFSRTVEIPSYSDSAHVNAEYKDGVLTVTLGKREEAKPKSIKVDFK